MEWNTISSKVRKGTGQCVIAIIKAEGRRQGAGPRQGGRSLVERKGLFLEGRNVQLGKGLWT